MVVTKKVIIMILYKANVAITETETDLRKTSHVWFGFFVVAFQVAVFRLTWRHVFRVCSQVSNRPFLLLPRISEIQHPELPSLLLCGTYRFHWGQSLCGHIRACLRIWSDLILSAAGHWGICHQYQDARDTWVHLSLTCRCAWYAGGQDPWWWGGE